MSGVEKCRTFAPDSQRLVIRDAVADDVGLLTTLIHEFATFERLRAVITEDAVLRDGFGAQPKFRALIAEWEKQPAGYALFFDYYSSFRGGRGIFLEDIYVRDQFRGKGAGKALFARLATIAQKERSIAIMFNVLDWNSGAINFYHSLGATFLDDWKTISLEGSALETIAQP
jgi:GNAT superfamily N-acetyltransferase